jgi:xanthine dehydrogenase accessory factor
MSDDARVWDEIARWRERGRAFALLTVIECRGFTPRKPGARMLLGQDGETFGTIGGGAIEREVLGEAQDLLARGAGTRVVHRHLTQELGMCCGGEMTVFVEVMETAPALHVLGAGYIAKPLAALAGGCGFRVTVVDERPEWASPERFPGTQVHCGSPEDYLRAGGPGPDDYVVVVTHDHPLDQRLVQELLRRPLRFLGMIGSVAKHRKFALRLRARGFSDEEIARLRTPLGIDVGARGPEEIAVSVMAELIAVRRGAVEPRAGWLPPPRAGRAGEAHATERPAPGSEETGGNGSSAEAKSKEVESR